MKREIEILEPFAVKAVVFGKEHKFLQINEGMWWYNGDFWQHLTANPYEEPENYDQVEFKHAYEKSKSHPLDINTSLLDVLYDFGRKQLSLKEVIESCDIAVFDEYTINTKPTIAGVKGNTIYLEGQCIRGNLNPVKSLYFSLKTESLHTLQIDEHTYITHSIDFDITNVRKVENSQRIKYALLQLKKRFVEWFKS